MAHGRAGARDRPRRRADQGAAHRDLRHRPAHPVLGRLGAAGRSRTPLVLGHEFVGEVVAVGARRRATSRSATWSAARATWSAASAATAWPAAATCAAATVGLGVGRDGAFAEYVALPASNVWVHRVPVDLDVAAIFDPFGNAVHTALSFPLVGEDVLITGAGPDRPDGRGRRPARRRPQRRDHRRQRGPPGAGPQGRRHASR